jgi:hypothetical protein
MPIKVDPRELFQHKGLEVDLQQLGMEEGDVVEYFVKVVDNDFVSGPKASTSAVFRVNFPSLAKKFEEVDENQDKMEKGRRATRQRGQGSARSFGEVSREDAEPEGIKL